MALIVFVINKFERNNEVNCIALLFADIFNYLGFILVLITIQEAIRRRKKRLNTTRAKKNDICQITLSTCTKLLGNGCKTIFPTEY